MRWSYIISRVVVVAVIWLAVFFGLDPLIKWGMRKTGESITGAKVDIGKVKTKFFPPSMTIEKLAAASKSDPWTNMVEFNNLSMSIEGRPLFEKAVIVREASLSGLRFNTKRSTSGKLPFVPPSAMGKKFAEWTSSGKGFAMDRFSSIKTDAIKDIKVAPDSLESVKLANELKAQYAAEADAWKTRLEGMKFQERAKGLEERFRQLEKESDTLKQIQMGQALLKDADALKNDIAKTKDEVTASLDKAKGYAAKIEEAKKRDTAAIKDKMHLPDMDPKAISVYLLGPQTGGMLEKYLGYYEKSRKYIPAGSKAGKIETPARKGTVVHFPKEKSYPKFAIRKMAVTGVLDIGDKNLDYSGVITGITNQPAVYGQPIRAAVDAQWGERRLNLQAVMDHVTETPKDSLSAKLSGWALADMKAGDPASLEVKSSGGTGAVDADFAVTGDQLDGKIKLTATGIGLTAAIGGGGDAVAFAQKAVSQSLAGIKTADASIGVSGTLSKPSLDIDSSIGSAFSKGIKAALGQEIENYRKALEAKVSEAVAGYQNQLNDMVKQKQNEVLGQLNVPGLGNLSDQINKKIQDGGLKKALPQGIKIPQFKF